LIQAGANVNIPNRDGLTPFHTLLMPRRPAKYPVADIIMCLHNGANVLTPTRDAVLPFQLFLNNCDEFFPTIEHVTVFLDKGADYNTHTRNGVTVLEYILAGSFSSSNLQTKACEDVRINMRDSKGNSPLHLGLWTVDAPTNIKRLLHRGFAPNAVNDAGDSPLWRMLEGVRFCETAVQALLDGGACPMQRNSTGDLPLYLIARKEASYPKKTASNVLLDSYLQHGNFINGQTGPSEDEFWWHSYRRFLSCGTWSAVPRPPVPAPGMPADIATALPKMMLAIAAARLLHRIKDEYSATEKGPDILQRPNVEGLRNHTVRILKDCSLLKLDIDVGWYHFMLDLMP
jgi:ankyrin repeat protein